MKLIRGTRKIDKKWLIGLLVVFMVLMEQVKIAAAVMPLAEQALLPGKLTAIRVIQRLQLPVTEIFTVADKAKRIKDLELELAVSLANLTELENIKKENEQLRSLLDQKLPGDTEVFVVRPILALSYPAVMGGSIDGITQGSVVTLNQILLGRISEVGSRQSRVELLGHASSKPILAVTESGDQGIIVGDGKRILLKELPKRANITNGQRVTTIGQEGVPAQLLIGTIGSVDENPSTPTQTAVITQPLSFYESVLVEVW